MAENQVASLFEDWNSRTGAESNEQIRIGLLQMRKPPSIPVFGERYRSEGHVWGGRPRPPKYAAYPGRAFLSVTDEHARFGPERSCLADGGIAGRIGGVFLVGFLSMRLVLSRCRRPAVKGARATKGQLQPQLRIHPQPAIILRPPHQPSPDRILPNICAFFPKTLIRSQHMVKRLFLPNRPRTILQLIYPVGSSTLQALQNVNQRKRPAIAISKSRKQQMNMIRHDDSGMQMNPPPMFAKAVVQHQISSLRRQNQRSTGTECHKKIGVRLLQMRQPPTILVLVRCRDGGHGVVLCGAGAPARQLPA